MFAIAIPNLVPARMSRSRNSCETYLRQIAGAKEQYSVEHGVTNGMVAKEQLLPYLREMWPQCPAGGAYSIGSLGESPDVLFRNTPSKFNSDPLRDVPKRTVVNNFPESQRDSATKPRVARNENPG